MVLSLSTKLSYMIFEFKMREMYGHYIYMCAVRVTDNGRR